MICGGTGWAWDTPALSALQKKWIAWGGLRQGGSRLFDSKSGRIGQGDNLQNNGARFMSRESIRDNRADRGRMKRRWQLTAGAGAGTGSTTRRAVHCPITGPALSGRLPATGIRLGGRPQPPDAHGPCSSSA